MDIKKNKYILIRLSKLLARDIDDPN